MFGTFMLAAAYLTRYRRTGAAADLAVMHQLLEQTAAAALGIAWVAHYERTRAVADLAVATRFLERALTQTSRDDALRPWLLAHLGFAFWVRHSHHGSLDDLDRAVTYSQQACAATTADHPARGLVERFHVALAPAA
ncbi:hypothetical protein [Mycobacterium sp. NPDC050041]|uniref:hypothetical protein n=1 Tax=Mycobacterium sp. NPDC050041 TaxID=3364293 RepID=UPI003C2C3FC4